MIPISLMPQINLLNPVPIKKEYPCPICHHGKISQMTMMESFACSFCQHIFTINFAKQSLKLIDAQLLLSWHWNGKRWRSGRSGQIDLGIVHLIFGLIFISLPTSIVAVSTFIFPPLPGSPFAWLGPVWIISTLIAHLFCLVVIVIEYYQWPLGIYFDVLKN